MQMYCLLGLLAVVSAQTVTDCQKVVFPLAWATGNGATTPSTTFVFPADLEYPLSESEWQAIVTETFEALDSITAVFDACDTLPETKTTECAEAIANEDPDGSYENDKFLGSPPLPPPKEQSKLIDEVFVEEQSVEDLEDDEDDEDDDSELAPQDGREIMSEEEMKAVLFTLSSKATELDFLSEDPSLLEQSSSMLGKIKATHMAAQKRALASARNTAKEYFMRNGLELTVDPPGRFTWGEPGGAGVDAPHFFGNGAFGYAFGATWHQHGLYSDYTVIAKVLGHSPTNAASLAREMAVHNAFSNCAYTLKAKGSFDIAKSDLPASVLVQMAAVLPPLDTDRVYVMISELAKAGDMTSLGTGTYFKSPSGYQRVKLVRQVAKALKCIARAGYVHRDIKFDNVFVTWSSIKRQPQAMLADFGIAVPFADAITHCKLQQTSGTPGWIPEWLDTAALISFQAAGNLDAKCDVNAKYQDVYALGKLMYNYVKGGVQRTGLPAVGENILCEAPNTNPAVGANIEALILSLTAEPAADNLVRDITRAKTTLKAAVSNIPKPNIQRGMDGNIAAYRASPYYFCKQGYGASP